MRKLKLASIALLLAAMVPVAPAFAQETRATPGSPPATAQDRAILHDFARCVARRSPSQAAYLIAGFSNSDENRRAMLRLTNDWSRACLGRGVLRFAPELFIGGMAERLIELDAGSATLASRVALNPALAPLVARNETEVMSICIARAAPAEVASLFASAPGTPEERAAFQAIGPSIAPCLAQGAELRVNRPGLRAILALAVYRMIRHNAASAAAGN
jgi:hypothetical protein